MSFYSPPFPSAMGMPSQDIIPVPGGYLVRRQRRPASARSARTHAPSVRAAPTMRTAPVPSMAPSRVPSYSPSVAVSLSQRGKPKKLVDPRRVFGRKKNATRDMSAKPEPVLSPAEADKVQIFPKDSLTREMPVGPPRPLQGYHASGRKKAVLVGINYANSEFPLSGCRNDVRHMRNLLMGYYGFRDDEILLIEEKQATKAFIWQGLHWLVNGASAGDALVFHFAGHGRQTEDLDGDEEDGFDETLVPYDFDTAGDIVDDDLFDVLVRNLPSGVKLTCVMDCCHSGTMLDLPYVFSTGKAEKKASQGFFSALFSMFGGASRPDPTPKTIQTIDNAKLVSSRNGLVTCLSGCLDEQTSADIAAIAQGAMTNAFIRVHDKYSGRPFTFAQLIEGVRHILHRSHFSQIAQLSSSHKINFDAAYSMKF